MACTADCPIISDPEAFAAARLPVHMERIEEIARDGADHWWRNLLACRTCGQLYFHEFYEEIDWGGGNDPQFTIFVPVKDRPEALAMAAMAPGRVTVGRAHLRKEWPAELEKPRVYWAQQG
jgi:hypothetical protein